MIIDCGDCVMEHTSACDDCIVTVLLEHMPQQSPLDLGGDEADALSNLAEAGLVAPLRLVPRVDGSEAAAG
jgi:hypothetical protein